MCPKCADTIQHKPQGPCFYRDAPVSEAVRAELSRSDLNRSFVLIPEVSTKKQQRLIFSNPMSGVKISTATTNINMSNEKAPPP